MHRSSASGTEMVNNINSGGSSTPLTLASAGDILYIQANDGTNGYELWTNQGVVTEVTYS